MELILWRHAEAEDGSIDLSDAKRRLTEHGEEQAREMARWLKAHLPKRCRILVSPTQRTEQTVHRLQMTYEIEPKVGVGGTAQELLKVAGWPLAERAVLIVGHQPTLGEVAALALTGKVAAWPVKKGAVWWLSHRERDGIVQTQLKAVINPNFL
jgi:phosphohistidine phosphatase